MSVEALIAQNRFVVMEARAPAPGQSPADTRQGIIPAALATEKDIATVLVDLNQEGTFTSEGRIAEYYVSGDPEMRHSDEGLVAPAWRIRDWLSETGTDPSAFPAGKGYNSQKLREAFRTRTGTIETLTNLGLSDMVIPFEVFNPSDRFRLPSGKFLFVKPDTISDVGMERGGDDFKRARLMLRGEVTPELLNRLSGQDQVVVQRVENALSAAELAARLRIRLPKHIGQVSLACLRVYQPLWDSAEGASAVELRVVEPQDIGRPAASFTHLFRPEYVADELPDFWETHQRVHSTLSDEAAFGQDGYPGLDYTFLRRTSRRKRGRIVVSNVLPRPFSPSLNGQKDAGQKRLAKATTRAEVERLAALVNGR